MTLSITRVRRVLLLSFFLFSLRCFISYFRKNTREEFPPQDAWSETMQRIESYTLRDRQDNGVFTS